MTALSRDELIPSYLAAERAALEANRKYHEARDLRNDLKDQLVAVSRTEAADQIGKVVEMFGKPHKITRLCPHYLNASLLYPCVVGRTANGRSWAKRQQHAYSWIYNFELKLWEHGTVDADDGFKPSGQSPATIAEEESIDG